MCIGPCVHVEVAWHAWVKGDAITLKRWHIGRAAAEQTHSQLPGHHQSFQLFSRSDHASSKSITRCCGAFHLGIAREYEVSMLGVGAFRRF